MVRRAVDGPGADIRLQNILLRAELAALPPGAEDDRLRIHHALAANYATLGDYRQALAHGQHELDLRDPHPRPPPPRHPDRPRQHRPLDRRVRGRAGALRLFRELLPDMEQVFGPRHPDTLATRANIARWTGQCGDAPGRCACTRSCCPTWSRSSAPVTPTPWPPAATSRPDRRVRGRGRGAAPVPGAAARPGAGPRPPPPPHPGHPRQHRALDGRVRGRGRGAAPVPGAAARPGAGPWPPPPRHPGHPRQHRALDRRVRGRRRGAAPVPGPAARHGAGPRPPPPRHPGHPQVARWTGECGDAAGALRLYRELLPDMEEVLGPRHPDTLTMRAQIARLSAEGTAAAET